MPSSARPFAELKLHESEHYCPLITQMARIDLKTQSRPRIARGFAQKYESVKPYLAG